MSTAGLHVSVLGAGSWGTALAALASRQARTLIWARDAEVATSINQYHGNERYLPGIALPHALQATADFERALSWQRNDAEDGLIILGVPFAGLASTCARLAQLLEAADCSKLSIIWTCKGLESDSGRLAHEVVQQYLGDRVSDGLGLGVLSGPSFALEVARNLPVALTIATLDRATIERTTRALHGETARIYSSSDLIGVEIGGALKNVVAIASGISDGLAMGHNARAALITRGLAEIQRLGLALGGQADTFSGLTGLGDLVLTATGELSRNRQAGLAIGQGQAIDDILNSGVTAEGVRCVQAALKLGRAHGIELPITEAVHAVLFKGLDPRVAASQLLARDARPENRTPSSLG